MHSSASELVPRFSLCSSGACEAFFCVETLFISEHKKFKAWFCFVVDQAHYDLLLKHLGVVS
jgi:hypothetical protein